MYYQECFEALVQKLASLKKSIKREHSKKYLDQYLSESSELLTKCESSLTSGDLFEQFVVEASLEKCRFIFAEINNIIRVKLRKVAEENTTKPTQTVSIVETAQAMATFSDVEGALEKFDGRNKNVTEWLATYESVAESCAFTPVQKNLWVRRLLIGAAKLAVESEEDVGSFEALKVFLKATFKVVVKTADTHRLLTTTKKMADENSEEYAFRMKRIAKGGTIDELSLVDYIVSGLNGSPLEKAALYEAETFATLREKLPAYDRMQTAIRGARPRAPVDNHPRRPATQGSSRGVAPASGGSRNCHTCGKPGHFARECRSALKCETCGKTGHDAANCRKCYKCGETGHLSPQCPRNSNPQA